MITNEVIKFQYIEPDYISIIVYSQKFKEHLNPRKLSIVIILKELNNKFR
jgi:hypothetical protein